MNASWNNSKNMLIASGFDQRGIVNAVDVADRACSTPQRKILEAKDLILRGDMGIDYTGANDGH